MNGDGLITFTGFLNDFLTQHQERPDRPFCFILGAGASKQSEIPAGADMARQWLQEIHEREDFEGMSLEEWVTEENTRIPDFEMDNIGRFYPDLYARRFHDCAEAGYAFLESQMIGREPSYGYSVLAYLLSETPHKMVVTTNFDNLVADSLSIHSSTFPTVVGHDALAAYARVSLRRPLIAKIHGDLGFQPKSAPGDVCELPKGWETSLKEILCRFTPIVIGYDGNDGSLMGFLENLPPEIPDNIYWCFYSLAHGRDAHLKNVPPRVRALIEKRNGALVPISGFDEMMVKLLHKLQKPLGIPDLFENLKIRARERETRYDEQQRHLHEKTFGSKSATKPVTKPQPDTDKDTTPDKDTALDEAVTAVASQRKEKPWWVWTQEAESETDQDKKAAIYQEAIEALPDSIQLLGNYAYFLHTERKDFDLADEYFKRAIDAGPRSANNLGNYANFLKNVRKDYMRAEEYYNRAIAADPKCAIYLGNYANLLKNVRKDFDRAEQYYTRAIDADPKYALHLGNYANFLNSVRKDFDRAEEFFNRAIDADPKNANALGNYAYLLNSVRKDFDRAEEFYTRAIDADPKNANLMGNYCLFLFEQRRDSEAKEKLLDAESCADADANSLWAELTFYRLAHLPESWPDALSKMKSLLEKGARSPGWNLDDSIRRAEESGHPNVALLKGIAKVISEDAPLATLDGFPEWQAAVADER